MAQIKASEDLRPVSELKSSGAEIVRQVNSTGRPVVLTRHGRGVAVLVSLERFEELEQAEGRAQLQRALLEGEADVAAGRVVPHADVVTKLRRWAGRDA
jgi:antitoxin YefM